MLTIPMSSLFYRAGTTIQLEKQQKSYRINQMEKHLQIHQEALQEGQRGALHLAFQKKAQ